MDLLIAIGLVLQDKAAEETFHTIEERVGKAKTVEVAFKGEARGSRGGNEEKMDFSGALFCAAGNKVHFTLKISRNGNEHETTIVSDGTRMKIQDGSRTQEKDAPKNLRGDLGTMVCRVGLFASTMFEASLRRPGEKEENRDSKGTLKVSDLKTAGDDKTAKTLSHKIRIGELEELLDGRIWYDAMTHKLVKRTLSGTIEKDKLSITEVYESFILDGEIPEAKFKLPADR